MNWIFPTSQDKKCLKINFLEVYLKTRKNYFFNRIELLEPFFQPCNPPIYLHWDFRNFWHSPVSNIQFDELDFQPISNLNFTCYSRQKIQLIKLEYFRLENCKNQVQIDRGIGLLQIELPKFNSDCNLVKDSSASIPFPPGCDRNGHNFKIVLFLRTKLTQYTNGLK